MERVGCRDHAARGRSAASTSLKSSVKMQTRAAISRSIDQAAGVLRRREGGRAQAPNVFGRARVEILPMRFAGMAGTELSECLGGQQVARVNSKFSGKVNERSQRRKDLA
jgi:hypothetical protein